MKKRAEKFFAVSLAVVFSFTLLAMTAFAELNDNAQNEVNNTSSINIDSNVSSENASSKNPSDDGTGGVDVPSQQESSDVTVTFSFNGGTGGTTRLVVPVGTAVGDLSTPTKKGYTFSNWTSGGNIVSPKLKLSTDISLTAQWEKSGSSKGTSSRKKAVSSQKPVDTHQSEVEAAASEAGETISDPDAISSEDWSSLLSSSGSDTQSVGGTVGTVSSQSDGTTSGGVSWIFILGIVLIALAVCGIAAFIYLQFFHIPRDSGGSGNNFDNFDTASFDDINSDSSGSQRRGAPGPVHGGEDAQDDEADTHGGEDMQSDEADTHGGEDMQSDKADTHGGEDMQSDKADTHGGEDMQSDKANTHGGFDSSAVQSDVLRRARQPKEQPDTVPNVQNPSPQPKAQAKPVEDAMKDFDWDKFFNDDNI